MNAAFIPTYTVSSSERGLNGDSNPDLCDARAVLNQLGYEAKWELVIMCVYDELTDDGYRSTYIYEVNTQNSCRESGLPPYCLSSAKNCKDHTFQ